MKYVPYAIAGIFIAVGVEIYSWASHRDRMRMTDRNWSDAVRYKPDGSAEQ